MSVYPSTCHPFLSKLHSSRCFSFLSHPLSYFFTLSSNHSESFTSSLCGPSPSFLIRATCWTARQRDLRMDRIVLHVETVVECWSRARECIKMCQSCLNLFNCVHACSHIWVWQYMWSRYRKTSVCSDCPYFHFFPSSFLSNNTSFLLFSASPWWLRLITRSRSCC